MLWIGAGLVLMVLELALPGAFLLWLGLAAIGTGLLDRAMELDFASLVVAFGALSAVSIGVGLALRRRPRPGVVNAPGSGLIGREATSLSFAGREGRVRLGDSDWSARLAAGSVLGAGRLVVVGVEGTVLLVRPIE